MGSKLPSLECRCPWSCGGGTCRSPVLCLVVPFRFHEGFGDRRAEVLPLPRLPWLSPDPRPPALGQLQQGGSRGCPGRARRRTAPEPGRLTSVQKFTNGGKEARAGPETHLETSLLESTWAGVAVLVIARPDGGRSFSLRSVYSPPDRPEPSCVQPVSSGVGPPRSPCHNCGNQVPGGSPPTGSEPGFEPMSSDCSHVLCPPQPELG